MDNKEQINDSKFYEDKTFIHASCEIIVLLVLSYYFYRKNTELNTKIEELAKHMIEQNKIINILENKINVIGNHLSDLGKHTESHNSILSDLQNKKRPRKFVKKEREESETEERPKMNTKIVELPESESSDSDLDDELQEELKNLN